MSTGSGELAVLLIVGAYVSTAAIWDIREKRIPNWLTIPMFITGCAYQGIMSCLGGWEHLWSAVAGFLVGFGILFVLWLVGGGGAGDVKLMGALGVWLGGGLTLRVLFASVVLVCVITVVQQICYGIRVAVAQAAGGQQKGRGERRLTLRRPVLAFATPVAIATWAVLLSQFLLHSGRPTEGARKIAGQLTSAEIHLVDE